MPSFKIQADIFTRLSVFDSPKGSSNTFKTHKNISLYFKRRYLIIYNYSNEGCKNQTKFKLHIKMSLATPECKLAGFLASSRFLFKLASNSEFILNKIKSTQSGLTLKIFKNYQQGSFSSAIFTKMRAASYHRPVIQ